MVDDSPLVSVAVITYNSSLYVKETLDSILAQTYCNIELVISDDHSSDDTVVICHRWITEHEARFSKAFVVESGTNTGIAMNCQRAVEQCSGEWLKLIAGDDVMLPGCISDCFEYVSSNSGVYAVFGKMLPFGSKNKMLLEAINSNLDVSFFSLSIKGQLDYLIHNRNCLPAPAAFLNLSKMRDLKISYDVRIPMMEDYPLWIQFLQNGLKLNFIDKFLVQYRVGGVSTESGRNLRYYKSTRLFRFYYQYPIWSQCNFEDAINTMVNEECEIYEQLIRVESSKAYKIGRVLIYPFHVLRRLIYGKQ